MNKIKIIFFLFFVQFNIAAQNIDTIFSQKVAEQQLTDSTVQQRFDFHYYEGEKLKLHSDYRAAALQFIECLKIDSLNAAAWFELSKMYQFTSQHTKAYNTLLK
ncbi:MAG: hypothetical protein LBB53_03510, partial [Prevotellaceae bacterium]|nr:hypothetical protein [Prevotellaceae bacterium]